MPLLRPYLGIAASAAVSGGYHADAVHFSGSQTYLETQNLGTGKTARYQAGSFWIKVAADQFNGYPLIDAWSNQGPVLQIRSDGAGGCRFQFSFYNDAAQFGQLYSEDAALPPDVWANVRFDVDTVGQTGHIYVGITDVTDEFVNVTGGGTMSTNGMILGITDVIEDDSFVTCDLADYWWIFSATGPFDMSMSGLGPKFIDAMTHKPVYLGANGELPTGTSPDVFFSGTATTFGQPNLGTGLGFVFSGSLANASTSPSD